jgi:hypothetical protein
MNVYDAMRFAKVIDAVHTVPVHFGMFDDVDPEIFKCDGRVIPDIYKVIPLIDNERTELKKLSLNKIFVSEEKEMKELKKAQQIQADAPLCNEKNITYEENSAKTAEKTDKAEEKEPEITPISVIEKEDIKESSKGTVHEEENDYIYDESYKTVEIDTLENSMAYETLDTIVSGADEAEEILTSDNEYDNVDTEDVYEEYDDSEEEFEVTEYDEEYTVPSFDDFEPLSADEYIVDPSPDDFSSTGEIEIKTPEDVVEFESPDTISDAVLVDDYEDIDNEPAEEFSDEYGIEDVAVLDGADSCDIEFDSVPDFEEVIDADTELIYNTDDEETAEITADSFGDYDEEDISSKIDAYVREIEKFENGDTADFSIPDFDN